MRVNDKPQKKIDIYMCVCVCVCLVNEIHAFELHIETNYF